MKDCGVERGSNGVEFRKLREQLELFGQWVLVERAERAEWVGCSMEKMGKMQNYRGQRVWSRRYECQWVP